MLSAWAPGPLIYNNLGTAESENHSVTTHMKYNLHELFQEMFTSPVLPILAPMLC